MLKVFFSLVLTFDISLYLSAVNLHFFPKQPPYQCISFLDGSKSTLSFEKISSFDTPCIVLNDINAELKEQLTLVNLPKNKTVVWITTQKENLQLVETFLREGNRVHKLFSKKSSSIEKMYFEIKPDVFLLPMHLKQTLEKILKKYPLDPQVTMILYPNPPCLKNLFVSLSKRAFQQKLSLCHRFQHLVEALAYEHPFLPKSLKFIPTESFLIKKLMLTQKRTVVLKKEKKLLFTTKKSLLPKKFQAITFTKQDLILSVGPSLEDIHLGLGGFLSELEKEEIPTMTLHNSAHNIHTSLFTCTGSLYLFLPYATSTYTPLLKKLKSYFREHPDKSIFICYYTTPWLEYWNLYHYGSFQGSQVTAAIGLTHLMHEGKHPSALGGPLAECYLIKKSFLRKP